MLKQWWGFLALFCACVVYICQQNKEAMEAGVQTDLGKIGIVISESLLEPCLYTV